MEIGERIRRRREELDMTQDELARAVGYKSRSSINKIEVDGRGLPQKKIVDIAKALKVTPSYLMGWEDPIDVENGILLAELTAAQEDFMEHYFEMFPHQQTAFERLAYYAERLDEDNLRLLIKIARGMVEDE